MTSTAPTDLNGHPVHHIDAMTSASMWDKAGSLSPNGYNFMAPQETSGGDREMAIECKQTDSPLNETLSQKQSKSAPINAVYFVTQ